MLDTTRQGKSHAGLQSTVHEEHHASNAAYMHPKSSAQQTHPHSRCDPHPASQVQRASDLQQAILKGWEQTRLNQRTQMTRLVQARE